MPTAALLRARLAPDDLIEADLVDQLADASDQLAQLRAGRPSEPDAAWARHYALVQNVYNRILDRLSRLRKASGSSARTDQAAVEPSSASPAPAAPTTTNRPSPVPPARNRRERRRLEALHRSARPPADRLRPPPPPHLRYLSPSNPAFVSASRPVSGPRSPGDGSNATARPTP